ncbi:hypothetical protein BV372_32640 [Nostoc sp. T09]|uniref:hypothetical protein n=1 Tax=Nostoc sp. T09 TaxID=1932621 RepID=UPI000A3AD76D|nr:hypothetical protein [Nostoc sp. T09]OUL20621.1 hypothetical protein BV372_32640 [Nostoc sp. T09]
MNSDQSQPLIDFSHAKEPAQSLNIQQEKASLPTEEENFEQDPLSDDLSEQEKSADNVGERQIIAANIPGGSAFHLNETHD